MPRSTHPKLIFHGPAPEQGEPTIMSGYIPTICPGLLQAAVTMSFVRVYRQGTPHLEVRIPGNRPARCAGQPDLGLPHPLQHAVAWYHLTGLESVATYWVRVRAMNGYGFGDWSEAVSGSTE